LRRAKALRIVALNQLKFPRAPRFLDPLFAKDRIGHGLVKLGQDLWRQDLVDQVLAADIDEVGALFRRR
jgi:hypothetical protein